MTPISIGIDGYNLAMPNGTGVAVYGLMLGEAIRDLGHALDGLFGLDVGARTETREVMFYDAIGRVTKETRHQRRMNAMRDFRRSIGTLEALAVPITDAVQKQAFDTRLPRFDRLWSAPRLFETAFQHFNLTGRFLTIRMTTPPAIMHWTYPVPVRLAGARNVYTLHDLVPLRLPYTTLDVKADYHALVAGCIAQADHICTVSNASRDDIAGRFPIASDRITNTYQSSPLPADAAAAPEAEDAAAIEGIFGLAHRGYFLFFGAIEPKKNLGRLIEAFLATRTDTPLVIVGARAWQAEEELKLAQTDTAQRRIVRLEYLPRRLLVKLIRGARAVVFPSLFEGFGLPALEAMQLGAPLIASDAGSLPEVTGDAALSIDPYDVDAIAAALARIDRDADLRVDLSERGRRRSALFSPAAYRERLAAMYEAIAAAPPRRR